MCGIVAYLGPKPAFPILIDGLKRLEYRGYDSAGVAIIESTKAEPSQLVIRKKKGKVKDLLAHVGKEKLFGNVGIGHTRWATHGIANETNAHPHATDKVALVHNGIIENFQELRAEMEAEGRSFASDTDTEVVVHLVTSYLDAGKSPQEAVAASLKRLDGAFALAIIFAGEDGLMIGARRGSPLALGYGEGEMFLGSDAMALAPLTKQICYLDEGDWVVLSKDKATIYDAEDQEVVREIKTTALSGAMIGKGGYRHYMLKEIYEQPQVIGDTLHALFNPVTRTITLPEFPFKLSEISRVTIVACGTSYYAGMVAKYWLEQIARIPVEIDIASEFRYRKPKMQDNGLALFISQSGETADTLAALRYCREQKQHIVSLVNVPESSMARESDAILMTCAGAAALDNQTLTRFDDGNIALFFVATKQRSDRYLQSIRQRIQSGQ